jgi:diguanylate cyclase (GGDEF)-like protein
LRNCIASISTSSRESNDALGHVAGDALLMQVAARIRNCIREVDLVARFGGDEFVVVQIGLQRPEDAEMLATRLVRALSQPYDFNGAPASGSASIGIAMAPAAIVRAVVSLAHSLGIVVTAEGVETEEQLQRLRAEGCHEVQGYLFSPPRPSNEISQVLARCRQLLAKAA